MQAVSRRLQTLVGQTALPISSRIGRFAGILNFTNVAPSIGPRPVEIGEAIDLCELATRKGLTALARNRVIPREMATARPTYRGVSEITKCGVCEAHASSFADLVVSSITSERNQPGVSATAVP